MNNIPLALVAFVILWFGLVVSAVLLHMPGTWIGAATVVAAAAVFVFILPVVRRRNGPS